MNRYCSIILYIFIVFFFVFKHNINIGTKNYKIKFITFFKRVKYQNV